MKTLLTKAEKIAKLDTIPTRFVATWGKTGMHAVTLRTSSGDTVGSAGGCGYDKEGTVIGLYLNKFFGEELKRIDSEKFYGVLHYRVVDGRCVGRKKGGEGLKTYVDGGCGYSSMERIMNKIGFKIVKIDAGRWSAAYVLEPCTLDKYGYVVR